MSGQRKGLSSAWAINKALLLRGLDDIAETTLFGLGASAWYELEPGPHGVPVLRAYHPDRIKHGFYGLNVYAVRFSYLSDDVHVQVRERTRQGVATLITVDRFALPPEFQGAGAPPSPPCVLEYTMLVHGDAEGRDDSLYWIQGPDDASARPITRADLSRAWFRPAAAGAVATFYWHPVVRLNWAPAVAMRAGLRRHCAQMHSSYPTLGPGGLAALQAAARMLDEGERRPLLAAAQCAHGDGGYALGRDLMAAFVRTAGAELKLASLAPVARHFDQCARLWSDLLHELAEGRPSTRAVQAGLHDVIRHEGAALAQLEQALDSHPSKETASCPN
jgi:hypothetical protein